MKKLLSLLLALVLTLTLFASCGETEQALTATELLDLGEKYLLDLDYEQAIVYFNQVIEVEPRNSRAYMGAAEAYVGLGDTDSAINLLKTALDVFTDDEEVTIQLLEMLIEIDPTNVEWYLELAQIYINNSDRTSAISILKQGMDYVGDDKTQLYDKLIEIDSDTTEWYFELAEVYEALSNIPSAVDTLELGLNNFDDDATKIDFSEELIEIDETNAEWYLTIAYIYIAQGDTDSAIAILREGLEKASDTTEIEALLNQLSPDLSELKPTSMYSYDEDGNITNSLEYEYYSNGNMAKSTFVSEYGATSVNEYDSNGNIVKSTSYSADGDSGTINEYEYDDNGNIVTQTYSMDGLVWSIVEYEYDTSGNLVRQINNNASYTHSGGVYSDAEWHTGYIYYEYEYDSDGNITKKIARYEYGDSASRHGFSDDSGEFHAYGTQTTEYEYDEDGNVTKITTTNSSTDGTVVVSSNEVSSVSTGTTSTPTVEYDAYGKVISYSYSTTIDGVTTTYYTEYEYEYNDDGKVQKCVMTTYNADTGNITAVGTLERIS
ncbi:MAG: tetratricopeptide repeat protein [Oscillospiraceae bacterium]|nr:tetratricopeptide repeat protein [Oscillospiraceae bacterium]